MLMGLMLRITDRLEIKVLTNYLNKIRHNHNMRTYFNIIAKGFDVPVSYDVAIDYINYMGSNNSLSELLQFESLSNFTFYLVYSLGFYNLDVRMGTSYLKSFDLSTKDTVDLLRFVSLDKIQKEDLFRDSKSRDTFRFRHLRKVIKVRGGYK